MRRHFSHQLKTEGCKVKAMFLVFVVTAVSRGAMYLVKVFFIEDKRVIAIIYDTMYNVWEVLPLCYYMLTHY